MDGLVLYPLAQLKERKPLLWSAHVERYGTSKHFLDEEITPLGCKRSEVLFFSPVSPQTIADAIRKVGKSLPRMQAYKFRADILKKEHAVVWRSGNYEHYDPTTIGNYSALSETTTEYYKRCDKSEEILPWYCIPQILYKGTLNISGLEIVESK
jgi:hypothetical protein